MEPLIIGIAGYAQSGKTSAAVELVRRLLVHEARIIPLAAPIKRIADQMGWNGHKDEKGRKLLQLLGTECGRNLIGPDCWIEAWERQTHLPPVAIIDDIRFPNEADWVKHRGGILFRVFRPEVPVMDHESERALDNYPMPYIYNATTISDLGSAAEAHVRSTKEWKAYASRI